MKKLILSAALALGLAAPAYAQAVNHVPQVGDLTYVTKYPTYSATAVGLVPAASATDIFCISAGATRSLSIKKITIAGTAGTAITTPFLIYQRSAVDTGGTAATGLALPVATPLSPADVASTATLISYTANPTVAATPVLMGAVLADLTVTTASGGDITAAFNYGSQVDLFEKALDLPKGSALQYCINLNGVSVSTGVLTINMEWQEIN